MPSAICDLPNLEELSLRGELPYDVDDPQEEGDEPNSPAADPPRAAFSLPARFRRLNRLRVLRLDCHVGMIHLPPQVSAPGLGYCKH